MTVLVVDDSAPVRERLLALISEAVASARVNVRGANNVAEALAALEHADTRAVMLDFRLLGEHGLDVLARVRALARDAVLIVLTNEASDYHRRECVQRGADYFFDKSHDFERAIDVVVGRVLETRGS